MFTSLLKIRKSSIYFMLLFLVSILIINTYQFFYKKELFEPANSLIMSSLFSQIGIIIFMIMGLMLAKLNLQKGSVIRGDLLIEWFFSIIQIFLLTVFFYSIFLMFIFIPFIDIDINFEILDIIKFTLIYWFLPFLISGILGYSIFTIIKNNFTFVFIVFISVVLGTLGAEFINSSLYEKISLFHHNPSFQFHPLYGLPVDYFNSFKRITILVFSLMILPVYYLINRDLRNKRTTLVILFLLILLLSGIKITKSYPVISHAYEKHSTINTEPLYYKKLSRKSYSEIDNVNFKEMTGDISVKNQVIEAKLNIYLNEDTLDQKKTFSLYHGFDIEYIRDKNGINLNFKRHGDIITINTDTLINEFSISYKGRSSPLNPAGGRSVFLPNYFPWLPTDNVNQAFDSIDNNMVHRNSLMPISLIKYDIDLSVNSKYDLLINGIESKGAIKVESRGVTLLSNDFQQINKFGHKYILPTSWWNIKSDLPVIEAEGKNVIKYVNSLFNSDYKLPKNIIVLPMTVHSDYLLEEDVWFSDDVLIVNYPFYFTMKEGIIDSPARLEEFAVGMIAAITWKQDSFTWIDNEMMILFNSIVAESYFKQNNYRSQYFESISEMVIQKEPLYTSIIEEVGKLLSLNNPDLLNRFLNSWYETAQKNNGELTASTLMDLLEEIYSD